MGKKAERFRRGRIGLLGGTFNPIQNGHLRAAEAVRARFDLDRIMFIPSFIPPHKQDCGMASPKQRLEMVERAVSSIPGFEASPLEVEAEGTSYSILTLNKVKQHYPRSVICFILGIDAFLEIETWREYERVLGQCSFVVVSRPGFSMDQVPPLAGRFKQKIVVLPAQGPVPDIHPSAVTIFLLQIEALEVSSTEVRERVRRGKSIKGLVPESVEAYIRENKLYQEGQ